MRAAARELGVPRTTLRRALAAGDEADRQPAPLPSHSKLLRQAARLMRADGGEVLTPVAFRDARNWVKLLRLPDLPPDLPGSTRSVTLLASRKVALHVGVRSRSRPRSGREDLPRRARPRENLRAGRADPGARRAARKGPNLRHKSGKRGKGGIRGGTFRAYGALMAQTDSAFFGRFSTYRAYRAYGALPGVFCCYFCGVPPGGI